MRSETRIGKSLAGILIMALAGAIAFLPLRTAFAAGTAAGTVIASQSTVQYSLNGVQYTQTSNTNSVRVDTIINNSTVWQDLPPGTAVSAGQTNAVLTMTLHNTGNGTDTYLLSVISTNVSGTDFTPAPLSIHLDSNGNGIYDPGTDQLYVPGTNDPVLAADGARNIFILGDIPASGVTGGQKGWAVLTAASRTGSGPPGRSFRVSVSAGPTQ